MSGVFTSNSVSTPISTNSTPTQFDSENFSNNTLQLRTLQTLGNQCSDVKITVHTKDGQNVESQSIGVGIWRFLSDSEWSGSAFFVNLLESELYQIINSKPKMTLG